MGRSGVADGLPAVTPTVPDVPEVAVCCADCEGCEVGKVGADERSAMEVGPPLPQPGATSTTARRAAALRQRPDGACPAACQEEVSHRSIRSCPALT